MITLSRNQRLFGCFIPNNFDKKDGSGEIIHEIQMNVQYFAVRKLEESLSTLVHEMVHLLTFINGEYGRGKYHNKKWAFQMKMLGLIPSSTGEPGGAEVGQTVSNYIEKGGIFEEKTKVLIGKSFLFPLQERLAERALTFSGKELQKRVIPGKPNHFKDDEGNEITGKVVKYGTDEKGKELYTVLVKEETKWDRVAYTCACKPKVWAIPGLNITCNKCGKRFKN